MPGTVVGSLSSLDPNALDLFTYSIVGSGAPFALSGATLVTTATFDFEASATQLVTVQSADDSGLTVRKTLTINVLNRNDAPTGLRVLNWQGSLVTSIDENRPIGTVVGIASGVDQDCCDTFRYSMVDSSRTLEMQILPNGSVVVATIQNVDFETRSLFNFSVVVEDDRGLAFRGYYSISVRDINEVSRVTLLCTLPVLPLVHARPALRGRPVFSLRASLSIALRLLVLAWPEVIPWRCAAEPPVFPRFPLPCSSPSPTQRRRSTPCRRPCLWTSLWARWGLGTRTLGRTTRTALFASPVHHRPSTLCRPTRCRRRSCSQT